MDLSRRGGHRIRAEPARRRAHTVRPATLIAVMVVALLASLSPTAAPTAAGAATARNAQDPALTAHDTPTAAPDLPGPTRVTPSSIEEVRDVIVDPDTGNVLVAGDDQVDVFDPDGAAVGTLTGIDRAGGLAVTDGAAYVTSMTNIDQSAVHRIDPASATTTGSWPVAASLPGSVAVVGGTAWLTQSGTHQPLLVLDLATGAVVERGGAFGNARIVAVPGRTDRVVVVANAALHDVDVSGAEATVVSSVDLHTIGLRDVAFSADGTRLVWARSFPYVFPQRAYPSLTGTGHTYDPGGGTPAGIANSADGRIWVGTVDLRPALHAWPDGSDRPLASIQLERDPREAATAVSPDGRRAYVVTDALNGSSLATVDLEPAAAAVTPSTVVAGLGDEITITGANLGVVEAATVLGAPAEVVEASPTSVRLRVPTDVGGGTGQVVLTTPLGSSSLPFTVIEDTGATLTGTVSGPGGPATGIEILVRHRDGTVHGQATTDADGRYTIGGLPLLVDARLETHDPSGATVDQVVAGLDLTPINTVTLDLSLSGTVLPPAEGPIVNRTPLPGTPLAIELDEARGRAVIAVGDGLVITDEHGRTTARVLDVPARDLAIVDDEVFVVGQATAPIERIDLATLRRGPPLGTGSHHLATAGGYLWTHRDGWTSPMHRVDPDTGEVVDPGGDAVVGPELTEVSDRPDLLVGWALGSKGIRAYDVGTGTPVLTGEVAVPTSLDGLDASDDGLVRTSDGTELTLPDLALTGRRFRTTEPSSGGGLAGVPSDEHGTSILGAAVVVTGSPVAATWLDSVDRFTPTSLTADGQRVLIGADGDELLTWDLAPRIAALEPATVVAGTATRLAFTGHGLGAPTAVTVGGVAVHDLDSAASSLEVRVPPTVTTGTQPVAVTTPFGTAITSVVVEADAGAAVTGVVAGPDGRLAGIEVRVESAGQPAPTTVSGVDGTYRVDGLAWSDAATLTAHDPEGRFADRRVADLAIEANATVTVDVVMARKATEAGPDAELARRGLGGRARSVLAEPSTGRTFVSAGDAVQVFDTDGRPLSRRSGLWDADQLVAMDGVVYVNLASWQQFAAIDASTLEVAGRWPTGVPTNGDLAAAGGRLWFTNGDGADVTLSSLDPVTGIVTHSDVAARSPELTTATGRPDELLVFDLDGQDGRLTRYDATGAAPTVVASGTVWGGNRHAVASGAAGLAWSSGGDEATLDPPTPATTSYETGSSAGSASTVAATDANGGLVAFGGNVYRHGDPVLAARTYHRPVAGGLGFDASGDRLLVSTADDELIIWDLAPHVSQVDPAWLRPGEATTVELRGTGLATLESATVGGVAVDVEPTSTTTALLHVPAAATDVGSTPAWLEVTLTSELGTTSGAATFSVGNQPPDPPRDLYASVEGDEMVVSWSTWNIEHGSSPIDAYEVTVEGTTTVVPSTASHVVLPAPPPGWYEVSAVAVSADGTSEPARYLRWVLWGVGCSPTDVALAPGPGSATLTWSPPTPACGGDVTDYLIEAVGSGEQAQVDGDRRSLDVTDLPAGEPVTYRVRALIGHDIPEWATSSWGMPRVYISSDWAESPEATPTAPVALFDDVPAGHPLYWEILSAVRQGVTIGNGDGTFGPAAPVTRQAAVTFLWRAAGSPTGPFPDPGFPDVPDDHPFATPIAWAAAEGITTGGVDGRFRPAAPVTRQAMIAFLWRAAHTPAGPFPDPDFTDVGPDHAFATPIAWAKAEGITTGNPDGTFAPTATVTRQAAVAFLVRPTWPQWQPLDDGG